MKNPRYLSLDFEGTLVNSGSIEWYWKELIPRLYSKKTGLQYLESMDKIMKDYDAVGAGRVEWYQPIFWFKRYGIEDEYSSSINALAERMVPFRDAKNLRLPHGIRLIICSGSWPDIIGEVLKRMGLKVDGIFVPTQYGMTKKEPEFYRRVSRSLNVKEPSLFLHVGDNPDYDYFFPKAAGWCSVLIDRDRKVNIKDKGIRSISSLTAVSFLTQLKRNCL